jgi:hypothetical protein
LKPFFEHCIKNIQADSGRTPQVKQKLLNVHGLKIAAFDNIDDDSNINIASISGKLPELNGNAYSTSRSGYENKRSVKSGRYSQVFF